LIARLYTAPTPNAGDELAVGVVSDGRWLFRLPAELFDIVIRKGNVGGGSALPRLEILYLEANESSFR